MGLRTKFFAILLALVIVPLLFVSYGAYWFFHNELKQETLDHQNRIAQHLASSTRRQLASAATELNAVASSRSFLNQLQKYMEGDVSLRDTLLERFHHISEDHGISNYLAIVDKQGSEVLRSGSVDITLAPLARLSELDRGDIPDSGVYRDAVTAADGRRFIRALVPLYHELQPGIRLGFIVSLASTQKLDEILATGSDELLGLWFANDLGRVFSKNKNVAFDVLPDALINAMYDGEKQFQISEISIDSVVYGIRVIWVAENAWLGVMIDKDALEQDAKDFFQILVPIAALTFLFISLIFFSRVEVLLIKPIDQLIEATRKIAGGSYRPDIGIRSNDEMGELAEAFRTMGRQLELSNEQVTQLAFYDPLTKLPNRSSLKISLQRMIEIAKRNHSQLAVLFIDLDDFKKINDRLGHDAGDQLLIEVGERLAALLRSGDMLAGTAGDDVSEQMISRRGGDEFNAILNNVENAQSAARVAERLIQDINMPIMLEGSPVVVGASVGVALYPQDGQDADGLLYNADMAMYQAKNLGKNKYYLFTESINRQVHERLETEQRIVKGLREEEFELYFQPKIRLDDMQVSGFEALIRWHRSDGKLVSPAEFIPLAEESQLIHDIGDWVMSETMRHLQMWETRLGEGFRVAINVSAKQMAREGFAENLISRARQFNVPLNRLEVELTETSILKDEILVKQHLYALRTSGVKVSLDDFGTGYSSLTFLLGLPIDSVKIDRGFVMRMQDDNQSSAIVESVLDLCNKLSKESVAEGVETAEQLNYLVDLGCTEAQGYLFSRPLPADQVEQYFAHQDIGCKINRA